MSIGGLPALNDGNNTRGILYNRLIEDNDVQMFISAGNDGPGTNTIGDPGVVSKVMGVGAYIHKDTWRRNYGSDSPARQTTCIRSARVDRRRTARSSRRSWLRARRSLRSRVAERLARGRDVHPAARVRHVQRHVDGRTTGRRRRRAC